jgi:hypothetical protein
MRVIRRLEKYEFGVLKSFYEADSFALVDTVYLPNNIVVDSDVNDAEPPITFTYSNYQVNPSLADRLFELPQ